VAGVVSARTLFAPLGPTYDRYAAALSFGQDPRWRRFLVSRVEAGPTDTVLDVARLVHQDVARTLKFARLWGSGAFDGQQVGPEHRVADSDIVELHAR